MSQVEEEQYRLHNTTHCCFVSASHFNPLRNILQETGLL